MQSIDAMSQEIAVFDPVVAKVIDLILSGKSLKQTLSEVGLKPYAFNKRLQSDKAAAAEYARALEIKADLLADEVITIADTAEDSQKARNQIDVRKWVASKLYAQRYGERIDLNVTQTIDVGATLAEARARLRPVSDLTKTIDAQAIDMTSANASSPIDNKSAGLLSIANIDNTKAPDIFD